MKTMLVAPTHNYDSNYPAFLSLSDFPSGLAYLAASLKAAGHEVAACNPNNITNYATGKDMLKDVLTKQVNESEAELIGLGGLCTDYAFLEDAISIIRQHSKAKVVLGGGIINNDAEFIFNDLKPDYAIEGEGEEAIVALADSMHGTTRLADIANLWYWQDGKAVKTRTDYSYCPLDNRAFPDYEPFGVKDMLDNYSQATRLLYRYSRLHPRPFTIVTARSCPFKCSFCVHDHGPKYRARSIENIMAEIEQNYERYKFNILLILDELFAVNKTRMKEFCDAVIEGKEKYGWDFDWTFQTHASADLDEDTLRLAKKAGCFMFSYGIESASPKIIESMDKRTKVEDIKRAIELARKTDIGFSGNLIFGDPAETHESVAESLRFWFEYGQSEFIFLADVRPYPGSQIFKECIERGLIKNKKAYYENITRARVNMTAMSNEKLGNIVDFLNFLETSWLFVKETQPVVPPQPERGYQQTPYIEAMGRQPHAIRSTCPHCGKETQHRDMLPKVFSSTFLGTGCVHCNRKIRVNIAQWSKN